MVQGLWTQEDLRQNISWLELRAVHFALRAFQDTVTDWDILVLMDNVAAKAHINCLGGTVRPPA